MTYDDYEREQLRRGLAVLVTDTPIAPDFYALPVVRAIPPTQRFASGAVVAVIVGLVAVLALGVNLLRGDPTVPGVAPPETTTTTSSTSTTEVETEKTRADEIREVLMAREEYVAACMADAGFEYVAQLPDTEWEGLGLHGVHGYDADDAARLARIEGFYLFATDPEEDERQRNALLEQNERMGPPGSPNQVIWESLTREERSAYHNALWVGPYDPAEPLRETFGCHEAAMQAIPRPPLDPAILDLLVRVHTEFDARMADEPRILQAKTEVAACATAAGVDSEALRREFTERTGMPHSQENVLKADPEVIAELRAEEIRQAEAFVRCEAVFFETRDSVGFEVERAVLEEIPGALEAVLAEQGRRVNQDG